MPAFAQPVAGCREKKAEQPAQDYGVEASSDVVSEDMEVAARAAPPADLAVSLENTNTSNDMAQYGGSASNQVPEGERMLDRDGQLSIQVGEYQTALDSVKALVKGWGGYLESVVESNSDSMRVRQANISLRVPKERFDEAMAKLPKLGLYVHSRSEEVQDVTRQYQDNVARLKTRKELEAHYLALLKKARNVREIMDIERELNNIRYEIESAEAQKKVTEFEVKMSHIGLEIRYEKKRSEIETPPGNGYLSRVGRSFGRALDNVGEVLLAVIEVLPPLVMVVLLIGLPIWWWRRRVMRRRRTGKA